MWTVNLLWRLQIRLMDSDGAVVNIGEEGEIQVKSENFFSGYKDDDEKTKQLYTDDGFLKTG